MFDLITRDFDDFLDDFGTTFFGSPRSLQRPPRNREFFPTSGLMKVEIVENKDNFVIKAAVPGFKKEDMHIAVNGDKLTITGERNLNEEKKDDDGKVLYSNYSYGKVSNSFALPVGTKKEDVSAKFVEGELLVTVKKPAEGTPEEGDITIE